MLRKVAEFVGGTVVGIAKKLPKTKIVFRNQLNLE